MLFRVQWYVLMFCFSSKISHENGNWGNKRLFEFLHTLAVERRKLQQLPPSKQFENFYYFVNRGVVICYLTNTVHFVWIRQVHYCHFFFFFVFLHYVHDVCFKLHSFLLSTALLRSHMEAVWHSNTSQNKIQIDLECICENSQNMIATLFVSWL